MSSSIDQGAESGEVGTCSQVGEVLHCLRHLVGQYMKLICSIALVVAMLIQPRSSKADHIVGLGAGPCSEIIEQYRTDPTVVQSWMMMWAQGFMSGLNVYLEEKGQYRDLQSMKVAAQAQMLRAYCDEHPMASLAKAVIDLFNQMPLKSKPAPR